MPETCFIKLQKLSKSNLLVAYKTLCKKLILCVGKLIVWISFKGWKAPIFEVAENFSLFKSKNPFLSSKLPAPQVNRPWSRPQLHITVLTVSFLVVDLVDELKNDGQQLTNMQLRRGIVQGGFVIERNVQIEFHRGLYRSGQILSELERAKDCLINIILSTY